MELQGELKVVLQSVTVADTQGTAVLTPVNKAE